MDAAAAPALGAGGADALEILESLMASLASTDPAELADEELARRLRVLERVDAVEAALRGRYLEAFDARDGHVADGQRTARTWLVHSTRVTRGQAAEHKAVQVLARRHRVLADALAEGSVLTKSVALRVARWTRRIPVEFRGPAEEIVVAAARAGADEQALAAICAEILYRTAPPDPDDDTDLDRGVSFETTFDGAGVLRGDLTPQCAAMVQAVLDALSAPAGGGDLRTRPQRYHDALEEAMRRLLASGLLPRRAGQPVKALVHISFAELCQLDAGSALQDAWIGAYRARWAARRAAASVATGDGGAWLAGDQARAAACDAMIIPVVTGDIDAGAVEELIALCVRYHRLRTAPGPASPAPGTPGDGTPGTPGDGAGARQPRQPRHPRRPGWADRGRRCSGGAGRAGHRRAGRAGAPDRGQGPAGRLRPGRGRVVPAPSAAGQGPERPVAAAGRRADRRHPGAPAAPGRAAGPDLPAPRRL